ncbi:MULTISPECIES: hypothetical protein [unclassified Pseudoalteromonas]|uniref:hypothetical protein n=1 Tax=unclassified Pseudoalteromonas TaxID=194690 RepID=UPI001EF05E83|nr:hypothetical protein [Pseudoalteromonas sp. L21]MCF7518328.1 hypothetical protein [Pseudoalteromonas sp. L21]UJX26829.1 hypothetical protein L3Q70_06720 [Pseudoalteromonas sp. CF6-2]|tara:strand:- start:1510 stop:1908 length:399 start_codon:yes stop_codon:yes gene_type:complete
MIFRKLAIFVTGSIAMTSTPVSASQSMDTASPFISVWLYLVEVLVIALPIVALLLLVFSRWKHLKFKLQLQAVLNVSAFLMIALGGILGYFSQALSTMIWLFMGSHLIVVGTAYLLLKRHKMKVRNALIGCW